MLLGLAVLADRWHVGPRSGQTVLSQIMAMAVGRHWAYYIVTLTITLVLALAANTSFGGLPVLDVRHPFGRRRYVSLPFTDYCPMLGDQSHAAAVTRI